MNLGQMHDRISAAIKRGTSQDAVIPFWVSSAARLLEQNYTFTWMKQTTAITIAGGIVPISYALSPLIKSVNWVKQMLDTQDDGTEWYGAPLIGVDDMEVTGITGGNPEGYWLEGQDGTYVLRFDAIPHDEYKAKVSWNKYTDWPTDEGASPALLLRGEYAVFVQSLLIGANEMRDPRMAETYGGLLEGALSTLLRSEEELKGNHKNDEKMNYSGFA